MFNALKRKRFEDSDDDKDDDDIDDIDAFDKKKNVRKNNKVIIKQSLHNIKKNVSSINKLDDSDVDIIDSKSNSPITTNSNNIENEAEEEVQRLLKSFITETIDITKADTITTSSSSNQNSKRAEEIDKLLKEIDKKKKVIFLLLIHIHNHHHHYIIRKLLLLLFLILLKRTISLFR